MDKASIRPYGLRHAYAQRHTDGGTDVDVLRELMDHRSLETTTGYYQVSFKRKQEAIRLLAPTANSPSPPTPRPWVLSNIDDQLGAFTTVHDRLTADLTAMPADTQRAVEDAGRELRKAGAAVFIPVDRLKRRR